jgi:hypothetical protein
MSIFMPEERTKLREDLISAAQADPQIIGAAITGLVAVGREDRWSDIDLALCMSRCSSASFGFTHCTCARVLPGACMASRIYAKCDA